MGRAISVGKFTLEADEDGCVEVPREIVGELTPHGLVEVPPKQPKD
jgi:hypothetical protein